jgi:DNA-binding ferritin-like protein (Dps family)
MRRPALIMRIQAAIEGKRKWQKKWRAHMARVKALPPDYQIVYKEIQNYLFKVGPVELTEGTDFLSTDLLSGIIDLFEEGAASGKGVLDVTGSDVAAFCDELIRDSKTFADGLQESLDQEFNREKKRAADQQSKKEKQ